MNKAYSRINWENYPSTATPLNETNLNKLDFATDEIDNRVISLDTTKLDKTTAATMVKDISFDESSGIFTVTYLNGSSFTIDTKLEKLVTNWDYDAETQQIILVLDDGTEQYIDLSELITQYEFLDSDTIAFSVDSSGKVSASVKGGSITEDKLQPNYLADIKVEVANAQSSASAAEVSATESKSYAVGGTGTRENEDSDNSKYYYEQAKQISQGLNGILPMGTVAFANLPTSGMDYGWMYNISDAFVSDERFNDGGGVYYGPGNNVIWVSGNKWDVTAGSSVTGVKGDKEVTYRQGNVNMTAEDIGAVPEDGDTAENTVTFTSGDAEEPTAWTDVSLLTSGEKHSSFLTKISTMFKNIRYLYKLLGTGSIPAALGTDIIAAINSLNTNLEAHFSADARLFDGASGVVCDNTATGNITWENTTFFNTLTISGYVNNVNTSFFSVNIPYVASTNYCVPIFNNGELLILIQITVNAVGSISWKSVFSDNKALSCYITKIFGV